MKKLSSPFTIVFKYGFPAFVLGLYGVGLVETFSGATRAIYLCSLFPLLALGLSLVCIPLKSVWIGNNVFIAGNGLWKKEVPFSSISDVKTTKTYGKPGAYPFVSLHMDNRPLIGRYIAFIPSVEMRRDPKGNDEQIKELMKEYSQQGDPGRPPQGAGSADP